MESSNSHNRDQKIPRNVRVEHLGRFGNYFFAAGFASGFGEKAARIEYRFKELDGPVFAEFSFLPPAASSGQRPFLELFWINDGYRLKHDVDIAVGLVNPLDWLNVLVLLRSYKYAGPFNLDYKPPRTTSSS